jgi:PmbA protein
MHSHLRGHPALIEAVKKLEKLNPDQFELFFQRKAATKIDAKNEQVDSMSRAEDVGLAVRLIKDRRMGFSYTTSLDKESIQKAMETASEIASSMPEDANVNLRSFGSFVYPHVDSLDPTGLKTSLEHKIALAKELEAACRKTDARIKGIRAASLTETFSEFHLVDSNGEHLNHQSTLFTASITCKAEDGTDSQMGRDFNFSNFLDNLDITSTARQAAKNAVELLHAGSAPTMKCPAVLRNDVVADLVGFLSDSFSAENISKGRSLLAGKHGQRLFSDQITLIDDGLLPGGIATSPFDGEGVPSSRTTLIDGGFISGTLYDCYYAQKDSQEPTGNASRSIKAPPTIGPTNLFLQKGKKSFEELLRGITRGILITDLMGLHTANAITGDFSLGASGILIENGQLTRPVRGFAVAGNVLDLFKKVTDLGNDFRFFGSVGAPSLRIAEISVGGSH